MVHAVPISKAYIFGHSARTCQLLRISARDTFFTDYLRNSCPSNHYDTALSDWLQGWDAAEAEHLRSTHQHRPESNHGSTGTRLQPV